MFGADRGLDEIAVIHTQDTGMRTLVPSVYP